MNSYLQFISFLVLLLISCGGSKSDVNDPTLSNSGNYKNKTTIFKSINSITSNITEKVRRHTTFCPRDNCNLQIYIDYMINSLSIKHFSRIQSENEFIMF